MIIVLKHFSIILISNIYEYKIDLITAIKIKIKMEFLIILLKHFSVVLISNIHKDKIDLITTIKQ